MPRYRIVSPSRVVTRATSSIHDTETRWERLSGWVEVDPEAPEDPATTARIEVDMTAFDAGDFLKNRKLKKDLQVASHPTATFELKRLSDVVQEGERLTATATGELSWRGRSVTLDCRGEATVDPRSISATAKFDLDVTKLGVTPPRVLMFKVADVVQIEVALHATAE